MVLLTFGKVMMMLPGGLYQILRHWGRRDARNAMRRASLASPRFQKGESLLEDLVHFMSSILARRGLNTRRKGSNRTTGPTAVWSILRLPAHIWSVDLS